MRPAPLPAPTDAGGSGGDVRADLQAALAALKAGAPADAEAAARRAVAARPGFGPAQNIHGLALAQLGEHDAAAEALAAARAQLGDDGDLPKQLGIALVNAGRYAEAVSVLPDPADATSDLDGALELARPWVRALVALGRRAAARAMAEPLAERAAREADGDAPRLVAAAALVKQAAGAPAARHAYARAVAGDPDSADAHAGLIESLFEDGAVDAAAAANRDALARLPDHAFAHHQAGRLAAAQGDAVASAQAYARAFALAPRAQQTLIGHIFSLHHIPGVEPEPLRALQDFWQRRFALAEADLPASAPPQPLRRGPAGADGRLRVGFLGGKFSQHPVGFFGLPAIQGLPRQRFSVQVLATQTHDDTLAQAIYDACDRWHRLDGLGDRACAAAIRRLDLDILVELTGPTSECCMHLLGPRLAPVQAKWIGGQLSSTALPAMDYFVTDPVATPPGWEGDFTETLIRLPGGYTAYAEPADTTPPAAPPHLANGYVTLGCFNKLAKICEPTRALWAAILRARPSTVLRLRWHTLKSPEVAAAWRADFVARGVAADQLDLDGLTGQNRVFRAYDGVDLALDPLTYSGGLTTCEALLRGVPVLTCPGRLFTARHAASRLWAAGLGDWLMPDRASYRATILALIDDPRPLASLRAELPARLRASALADPQRHGAELGHGLEIAWQRHVQAVTSRAPIDAGAPADGQVSPPPAAEPPPTWPQASPCLAPEGPP